jgi:hypothetical protein
MLSVIARAARTAVELCAHIIPTALENN